MYKGSAKSASVSKEIRQFLECLNELSTHLAVQMYIAKLPMLHCQVC